MAIAERPVLKTESEVKDPHQRNLAELAARHAIAEEGGGVERREREKKAGKLSARERVEFLLDEGTFEETDKFVTHRATDFGMAEQRVPGDGFITGYGRVNGRVVCLCLRRTLIQVFGGSLSEANAAEDCEDYGYGDAGRRANCGVERFGRSADSGGCGFAGGIYGYFFEEHTGERSGAADLGDSWAVCRRGSVFAGDYGLHADDGEDELHVCYRAGCDQDGDA